MRIFVEPLTTDTPRDQNLMTEDVYVVMISSGCFVTDCSSISSTRSRLKRVCWWSKPQASGMVGTGKQTLPGLGSNWKPSFGQQIYDGKIAEAKAVIEADRSAATKPDEVWFDGKWRHVEVLIFGTSLIALCASETILFCYLEWEKCNSLGLFCWSAGFRGIFDEFRSASGWTRSGLQNGLNGDSLSQPVCGRHSPGMWFIIRLAAYTNLEF